MSPSARKDVIMANVPPPTLASALTVIGGNRKRKRAAPSATSLVLMVSALPPANVNVTKATFQRTKLIVNLFVWRAARTVNALPLISANATRAIECHP